jgi:uncharacterized protein with NRDE domain
MCVIYFAFGQRADLPQILIANRDEFYERPTAAAAWWDDNPSIFAGRDLVSGGTWLGVTKSGRFAAVTNYRDPNAPMGNRSRGLLVSDFLRSGKTASEYVAEVSQIADEYSGFNLIAGEIDGYRKEVSYFSNHENIIRKLDPGVYGLSNHLLDTPWPKVSRGMQRFRSLIDDPNTSSDDYFDLLADRTLAEDNELPDTGIGYEKEKALSAIFIETPIYGTRCSTVLAIDAHGMPEMDERVFV